MTSFAVQYLEDGPGIAGITPEDARARLQGAFERLPVTHVLLGWNLPEALIESCAAECTRAGAQLYRWHPLLTGDGVLVPRAEWCTVGLDGEPVRGFRGLPEFTFVCPNRGAVREAVLERVRQVSRSGRYEGMFLDRIRYPSPAVDPSRLLACFCSECRRAAQDAGLDLEGARREIKLLATSPQRVQALIQGLLDGTPEGPGVELLNAYLSFRSQSVSQLVRAATEVIQDEGLSVGLDCFSPALTMMVGQDLRGLGRCADWIKIMSYGHTLGPAGLPFELSALADWIVGSGFAGENEALTWLSRGTRLPLPGTREALRQSGLAPEALAAEVRRARSDGVGTLWAGIELVDVEGVTRRGRTQIEADLRAFRAAGAEGLVLSWDLWHIPLERLDLVRAVWLP
jgi:hypothetical protein